jgi:hypothetical protein
MYFLAQMNKSRPAPVVSQSVLFVNTSDRVCACGKRRQ